MSTISPTFFIEETSPILKRMPNSSSTAEMRLICSRPVSYTHLDVYKRQFLCCKLFAVKTEGLHNNPSPRITFQNRTIPLAFRRGGARSSRCTEPFHSTTIAKGQQPLSPHKPSKTALSHSLFVGRRACPSRNITAIIENKLIAVSYTHLDVYKRQV